MDRLISLLAAMLFALPTAAFLWFFLNKQLAVYDQGDSFLGSGVLWGVMILFALLALLYEDLFPRLIGKIWQLLIKLASW